MTTPYVGFNCGVKKKEEKTNIPKHSFIPASKGSTRTPLGPSNLTKPYIDHPIKKIFCPVYHNISWQ